MTGPDIRSAEPHAAEPPAVDYRSPERPPTQFEPDSLEDELMRTPFAAGFPPWRVAPDERVLVDVHPRRVTLVPPLVKLLIATLVAGIALGLTGLTAPFDSLNGSGYQQPSSPRLAGMAQLVIALVWLVLAVRWWVVPLIRWRRNRLAITNYRVVHALSPKDIAEIPLRKVYSVDRQGSTMTFAVNGQAPLVVNSVPKARRIARVVQRRIR